MALHRQEKRVTSKLWTTFLSMLVRNGVYIRVDMEIYLQHGLQQKCAGLVSAGCSQRDDMSSNSVF